MSSAQEKDKDGNRKRSYNEISFDKKVQALANLDSGKSIRQVARLYGVATGTIAHWKKNRETITDRAFQNERLDIKQPSRLKGDSALIDETVYRWFVVARSRNITINGTLLKEKAKLVAENIGLQNFAASTGWLDRFKRRHNIRLKDCEEHILNPMAAAELDKQEDKESEEEPAQPPPPTVQEALKAVQTAMDFAMTRDDMAEEIKFLDKFQKKLVRRRLQVSQQSTMHRFFVNRIASRNAAAASTAGGCVTSPPKNSNPKDIFDV